MLSHQKSQMDIANKFQACKDSSTCVPDKIAHEFPMTPNNSLSSLSDGVECPLDPVAQPQDDIRKLVQHPQDGQSHETHGVRNQTLPG